MRFSFLIGTVVLASACIGQSGSEVLKPPPADPNPDPIPGIPPQNPPAPHCPCDAARDQQQVRATVLGVEAIEPFTNVWRYELRSIEVLSEARGNAGELAAGDRFGGYWNGQLACGGTAEPFAAGAEVLALYRRGMQDGALCCEYIACSDACPSESEEGDDGAAPEPSSEPLQTPHYRCLRDCESQTAAACAAHAEEATLRGELLLMAWGDSFVVGRSEQGTATITARDLPALLFARDACMDALDDRFGTLYPPAPDMDEPVDGDAPAPGMPSQQSPPPGASPAMPMSTPQASAPLPSAPAGMNATNPAPGPPPAHPEEVRVRCR